MLSRNQSQQGLITSAKPFSSKSINNSFWVKLFHLLITMAFLAIALGVVYASLVLGRVFLKAEVDYDTPMKTEMPILKAPPSDGGSS